LISAGETDVCELGVLIEGNGEVIMNVKLSQ
jgi:hypothetical protein